MYKERKYNDFKYLSLYSGQNTKQGGTLVNTKANKYKLRDEVSFERRSFFGNKLIRGNIISYRYLNYKWIYLVESYEDKKLLTVAEDDIWLLEGDEK